MPRNARPRKRYRPGRVNPLAMESALMGVCRLHIDDRLRWQQDLCDSITAVARGTAAQDHWRLLFDAVNLVEELVRMRIAADPGGVVQDAQDAIVTVLDRQRDTGTRAVRAAELAALRTLADGWAELMDGITHSQRYDALERVAARLARVQAQANAGRSTPGVRVVQAPDTHTATPNERTQP